MPRKNYNKMYEENQETAPVEEPVVKEAKAKATEKVEEPKESDKIPATKPFMGTVTGGLSLNVRKVPGGSIVASIPDGAQVRVLDDSDPDWYKIESPDGYVMKKFIKKSTKKA